MKKQQLCVELRKGGEGRGRGAGTFYVAVFTRDEAGLGTLPPTHVYDSFTSQKSPVQLLAGATHARRRYWYS